MTTCPCGSTNAFEECCGPFVAGAKNVETPEQLMRSRYTAYTIPFMDYIERTMQGPAATDFNKESAFNWAKRAKWQGLEIINTSMDKDKGYVEFKAHYFEGGTSHTMHEISEFRLIDDKWYYYDGKKPLIVEKEVKVKIGRNEPCPCGSGKKYKKCCLLK